MLEITCTDSSDAAVVSMVQMKSVYTFYVNHVSGCSGNWPPPPGNANSAAATALLVMFGAMFSLYCRCEIRFRFAVVLLFDCSWICSFFVGGFLYFGLGALYLWVSHSHHHYYQRHYYNHRHRSGFKGPVAAT